jgi:Tfp pilus assembly protein PilW
MRGAEVSDHWARLRRRLDQSEGFTLVELLLSSAMALVLIGGSVGVVTTGLRSEPRIAERTADVQSARVTMERVTGELRGGASVQTASGTQLTLITSSSSDTCGGSATVSRSCRITYLCSGGQCTRTESRPDGTGTSTSEIVVRGISSGPVFTYSPSAAAPTFVGVALRFPASAGDDSITLTDGVTLRNVVAPAS